MWPSHLFDHGQERLQTWQKLGIKVLVFENILLLMSEDLLCLPGVKVIMTD